jgi:hypothetical protein
MATTNNQPTRRLIRNCLAGTSGTSYSRPAVRHHSGLAVHRLVGYWPDVGPGEKVVQTTISVSRQTAGTPTTETTVEQGRTVRTTTRPHTVAFSLGLPGGTTMTGACRVDHLSVHVANEPQA